jgi:hypothetical protein
LALTNTVLIEQIVISASAMLCTTPGCVCHHTRDASEAMISST